MLMWQFAKETKTAAKVGYYAQISHNFVWKLVVPKPRYRFFQTIRHKLSLYSIGKNVWTVLPENKVKVGRNEKKLTSSKNIWNFLETNIFNDIRDIR